MKEQVAYKILTSGDLWSGEQKFSPMQQNAQGSGLYTLLLPIHHAGLEGDIFSSGLLYLLQLRIQSAMNTDGKSRGPPAGVRTIIPGSSSSPASLEGTLKLVHETLIGKESKYISSKGNYKAVRGLHHLSQQIENSRAIPV